MNECTEEEVMSIINGLENNKALRKEILKTKPEDIAILSRVLSGHNNLNHHQTKMGLSFDIGCKYCGDKKSYETAEHIITKCPKLTQK